MSKVREQTASEEGLDLDVYLCSEGFRTIGYGWNLDANPKYKGKLIPDHITIEFANELLDYKLAQVCTELSAKWPTFTLLQGARRDAIHQMAYQLGVTGFMEFKQLRMAAMAGDWRGAQLAGLDSKWARQTPNRAKRVTTQIFTGAYYEP